MKEIIYLAIPYTWNPERSFEIANKVAAKLMADGHVVFSPISHSHPIAGQMRTSAKTDYDLWMKQDLPILSKCSKMVLVFIGEMGYKLIAESRGCQSEINFAISHKIPITEYYYEE